MHSHLCFSLCLLIPEDGHVAYIIKNKLLCWTGMCVCVCICVRVCTYVTTLEMLHSFS